MAHAPATTPPALTEEQILAQKQRFWGAFTSFIIGVVAFLAILLLLMDYFLV